MVRVTKHSKSNTWSEFSRTLNTQRYHTHQQSTSILGPRLYGRGFTHTHRRPPSAPHKSNHCSYERTDGRRPFCASARGGERMSAHAPSASAYASSSILGAR